MAIKVGKRKAQIGAGVMDHYQVAAERAMREIYEKIHNSPNYMGAQLLKRKRGDIARLNAMMTIPDTPGKGVDLELTRMRGIDFHLIDAVQFSGKTWIAAHTLGLQIQTVSGNERKGRYAHSDKNTLGEFHDLGDYEVYFPIMDLATPVVKNIHLIPKLDPWTEGRHFHQRAYGIGEHPTDMNSNSCWGGFAEPVAACMEACDLPDLLRILRIFVGRRNPHSLLIRNPKHEVFHDEDV